MHSSPNAPKDDWKANQAKTKRKGGVLGEETKEMFKAEGLTEQKNGLLLYKKSLCVHWHHG